MRHVTMVEKEPMEYKNETRQSSTTRWNGLLYHRQWCGPISAWTATFRNNIKRWTGRTLKICFIGHLNARSRPSYIFIKRQGSETELETLETTYRLSLIWLRLAHRLRRYMFKLSTAEDKTQVDTCLCIWGSSWHGKYSALLMYCYSQLSRIKKI